MHVLKEIKDNKLFSQVQGQGYCQSQGQCQGHGCGPWPSDKVSWKFDQDQTSRGFTINYSPEGQGQCNFQGQGQGHYPDPWHSDKVSWKCCEDQTRYSVLNKGKV